MSPWSVRLAVAAVLVAVTLARAADVKDFAGTWKTTMPKSVTNKSDDLDLTVEFDAKGKGFPKFVTPGGDTIFFAGAVTADLYKDGGKDKVVLLREWEVTLDKDKKTMTWKEVKGSTKLEFKK
jgi:hypothetical protein